MAKVSVDIRIGDEDLASTSQVRGKARLFTERARRQLRQDLPPIISRVKAAVAAKLVPGVLFKTTKRLLPALSSEMVENSKELYARIYIDHNKFPDVVAKTLESGSRAHAIEARNAPALFFFWERLGKNVAFRKVWHPGFEGRSFMESTLTEMHDEIRDSLSRSVLAALNDY